MLLFPLDTVTCTHALPCPYLHSSSLQKTPSSGEVMRGSKGVPVGWSKNEERRKRVSKQRKRRRERARATVTESQRGREADISCLWGAHAVPLPVLFCHPLSP